MVSCVLVRSCLELIDPRVSSSLIGLGRYLFPYIDRLAIHSSHRYIALYTMLLRGLVSAVIFGSTALAGAIPLQAEVLPPSRVLVERQATSSTPVPDGQCTNGPRTRNCWSNGYSISTDFDAKSPPDGTTVVVCQTYFCLS